MKLLLFLCAILPCFVQSLSVNRITDALSLSNIFVNYQEYYGFTPAPPPHTEEAKLARYVVHYSGNQILLKKCIGRRYGKFPDLLIFEIRK